MLCSITRSIIPCETRCVLRGGDPYRDTLATCRVPRNVVRRNRSPGMSRVAV
jgi:hypothetical protein